MFTLFKNMCYDNIQHRAYSKWNHLINNQFISDYVHVLITVGTLLTISIGINALLFASLFEPILHIAINFIFV